MAETAPADALATFKAAAAQLETGWAALAAERDELKAEVARLKRGAEPFRVGVNLDFSTEYSTDGRWSNAFRSFAGGGNGNPGWGVAGKPWQHNPGLQLSANGYPLADASAFSYLRGYAPGRYAFSREGGGKVMFGGRLKEVSPGVVELAPGDTMGTVGVRGVDPADPPRDFKLLAPDADPGATYRRPFLDAHKPFAVLRLNPDTQRTNRLPVDARVGPREWNQTSTRGVAYELLADLAAEAGCSLWIGVPDWADDAHAEDMARVLLGKLPAGKKLYVEYSNECIFNSSFDSWPRVREASTANPELTATNEDERHWQQCAWQSRRCGLIFRRVAADLGRPESDVRPVFGVQSYNPRTTEVGLAYLAATFGPPSACLWSIACTGYYKPPASVTKAIDAAADDAAGLDLLFDYYLNPATGKLVTEQARRSKHADIAARYGVGVDVYEASAPELPDHGNPATDRSARVADLAQDDPRAGECVRLCLSACRAVYGAGVACWYKGVAPREREGRYSLAPSLDKLDGPKFAAAAEFAARLKEVVR